MRSAPRRAPAGVVMRCRAPPLAPRCRKHPERVDDQEQRHELAEMLLPPHAVPQSRRWNVTREPIRGFHLTPGRRLSVFSRSAAASAITVPGGKIARAGALERFVILRRHHPANRDHDVLAAGALERGFELRHQRAMRRGERRDADNVYILLDGLARCFGRCREEWTDLNLEAKISNADAITF